MSAMVERVGQVLPLRATKVSGLLAQCDAEPGTWFRLRVENADTAKVYAYRIRAGKFAGMSAGVYETQSHIVRGGLPSGWPAYVYAMRRPS